VSTPMSTVILTNVSLQVSNAIYGLGKMQVKLNNLPDSLKDNMKKAVEYSLLNMNDQELANTVYS